MDEATLQNMIDGIKASEDPDHLDEQIIQEQIK